MTEQFPAMSVRALRAIRSIRRLRAAFRVRPLGVWLPLRVHHCRIRTSGRAMLSGVAETDVATDTFDALNVDLSCRIA
jgi:hypothetical protein